MTTSLQQSLSSVPPIYQNYVSSKIPHKTRSFFWHFAPLGLILTSCDFFP